MIRVMKRILNDILKEDGKFSFTRCMPFAGYILFALVSIYLVYNRITWGHYETFAVITGGGSLGTQLANKAINSKYNNPVRYGYNTQNKEEETGEKKELN